MLYKNVGEKQLLEMMTEFQENIPCTSKMATIDDELFF